MRARRRIVKEGGNNDSTHPRFPRPRAPHRRLLRRFGQRPKAIMVGYGSTASERLALRSYTMGAERAVRGRGGGESSAGTSGHGRLTRETTRMGADIRCGGVIRVLPIATNAAVGLALEAEAALIRVVACTCMSVPRRPPPPFWPSRPNPVCSAHSISVGPPRAVHSATQRPHSKVRCSHFPGAAIPGRRVYSNSTAGWTD